MCEPGLACPAPQVSQHARCRIRVQVSSSPGEAPQEGHKVSLMGLLVSHFPLRRTTSMEQLQREEG